MTQLEKLRQVIDKGKFPKEFPEFGGANLIVTKDFQAKYYPHDIVVYTEYASELSWLVFELKNIYDSEIDYLNKYDFYPLIGNILNQRLIMKESLKEMMHYVVNIIESRWGSK